MDCRCSGVTDDQKVNMAVAIHLQKTKVMEYQYKDFDSTQWRFFKAWVELRTLPKFAFPPPPDVSETNKEGESNEEVPGTVYTDDTPASGTSSSVGSTTGEKSHSGGKGIKAAKKERVRDEERKRKQQRDAKRDEK